MKLSKDVVSYKALKSPSIVTCDFCDKKFNNRYDSIVHNASHIIIPLWLQNLYNCNLCSISTTTFNELDNHRARNHTIDVEPINYIDVIKNETLLTEYKCSDVKSEINDESDNITVEYQPIRNRLKFEEDISPNGLISDLVTQCNVNLQLMNPSWLYPTNYSNCSINYQEEPKYNSINYSCLMKPGIFICKYCSKSYPNRFSLIKHEADHIKIIQRKPLLCLNKTLNSQITNRHPDVKVEKCKAYCDSLECGSVFNNLEQRASDKGATKCTNADSLVSKLCDQCFSYMKRQINVIYVAVGDPVGELGVRFPCDNCGKKYFVLKTVKRSRTRRRRYLDNEKRLKNIQHRLKKLNLSHKF